MTKTSVVRLRLSEEERLEWVARAEVAGLSLSDLIRQGVNKSRPPRRRPPPKIDPGLLLQLARIGANLNQLAKWANTHKSGVPASAVIVQLIEIDRELAAIRKETGGAD